MQEMPLLILEALLVGGLLLMLSRIGRRGLHFGVYTGELAHGGEEARAIGRVWNRSITLWTLCSLAAAVLAGKRVPLFPIVAPPLGPLMMLLGLLWS